MARLGLPEMRAAGNLDALYWWRGGQSREAQPAAESLAQRIAALAERAAAAQAVAELPQPIALPGNRLRASAEAQRIADRAAMPREEPAADRRALVGAFAASFALYRALRRRLLIRSGDIRKIPTRDSPAEAERVM